MMQEVRSARGVSMSLCRGFVCVCGGLMTIAGRLGRFTRMLLGLGRVPVGLGAVFDCGSSMLAGRVVLTQRMVVNRFLMVVRRR